MFYYAILTLSLKFHRDKDAIISPRDAVRILNEFSGSAVVSFGASVPGFSVFPSGFLVVA